MNRVADHYDCDIIFALTVNLTYVESVAFKTTHQNKSIIASTIYRPPHSSFD